MNIEKELKVVLSMVRGWTSELCGIMNCRTVAQLRRGQIRRGKDLFYHVFELTSCRGDTSVIKFNVLCESEFEMKGIT